ncbi:aldo/keto reductase [Algoriphagus halophytocola]|uniref:Aldo/keto reductase n=1 Tax=Algoriphagus halophytocola TaxID=2991499 RepID=A0ABY6MMU0_9BACT|nr:aldo/keto reductase [Algoriphagus sp. TR-M5]UZD24001.1 aldo/keto reductase [Algoriphagus sp. TR-M5]
MEKRQIPGLSMQISPISLGCMSLPAKPKESQAILERAIAAGINLLDTADLYQQGLNEELVGAAIRTQRDRLTIATKVGNQWRPDGNGWDWNPRKDYILKAVEDSLKRLNTDYIDLYQLHGGTLEDPLEEVFEAFESLKTQGKIRAYGISSIRPNVIRKVLQIANPATIMMQYSPLDRRPEEEVFPLLSKSQTRVLVRGALAKGLLIDKPASSYLDYSPTEVDAVGQMIKDTGYSPEGILIKFGLSQEAVGSLVIGASSTEQIEKITKGYREAQQIPEELITDLMAKFPINHYQQHR